MDDYINRREAIENVCDAVCNYFDVSPTKGYEIAEKALLDMSAKDDMTSSHSEAEIYKGCLSLMQDLTDKFYEYLNFIGVDVNKLDEEEQFSVNYSPMTIVKRLFLYHTKHSGGTSTMMKCGELGIEDCGVSVTFDFSEQLAEVEDEVNN